MAAAYAFPAQVLGTFPPALRDSDKLDAHRRSFAVGMDGRFKLIRDSLGQEEVYDLREDPAEKEPLLEVAPARLERLRALASLAAAEATIGGGPEASALDAETREALRELGYLE